MSSRRKNDHAADTPSLNKGTQSSQLGEFTQFEDDGRETMVSVNDVSMVFNMASQRLTNLKEYAIAIARHELMFKEFRALQHISIEVKRGDVFGILGTNGSGKSTLLKIIAGVLEPTEGSVEIRGNIAPLIELGAGFDFELTARENIYLNGALLGYPKPFIAEHFDEIVDFAEIGDFLDLPLKNYSSGMVARIAFAIATIIVPDILIVDEVLSVGDTMFQQKCERRIQTLISEYNTTVLIVSHNTEQVERLCNKAIWIEKSHPRLLGPADAVCAAYRALGGHRGSAKSETLIYELLEKPADYPKNYFETIGGDSVYGTAMRLFNRSLEAGRKTADTARINTVGADTKALDAVGADAVGADTVVIDTVVIAASGNANSLALLPWMTGTLNALPLVTSVDVAPDSIISSIRSMNTKRIVLLNPNDEIDDGVAATILKECPQVEVLDQLRDEGASPLSLAALDYTLAACGIRREADDGGIGNGVGESVGKKGAGEGVGGIADGGDEERSGEGIGDLVILVRDAYRLLGLIAPLMYRYHTPVLFADEEHALHLERAIKHLRELGVSKVLCVDASLEELGLSPDALAGMEVFDHEELWPYQFVERVRRICEGGEGSEAASDAHELIFVSSSEIADAFLAAPLARDRSAFISVVDKNNLDSVAGAIADIRGKAPVLPPFDHLTFLGGNTCFDDPIKDIFAKVVWAQRKALTGVSAEEQEH